MLERPFGASYLHEGGAGHVPEGMTKDEAGAKENEARKAKAADKKARNQKRNRLNRQNCRRHQKGEVITVEKRRFFLPKRREKTNRRGAAIRREYRRFMNALASEVCKRWGRRNSKQTKKQKKVI